MLAASKRLAGPPHRGHRCSRGLVYGLLAVALGGCATKRDIVDIQEEIRGLRLRQDSAFAMLVRSVQQGNRQALDSVAAASDFVVDLRGTLSSDIARIEQSILRFGEIVGQNQYTLAQVQRELGDLRGDFQELSDKVGRLAVDSLGFVGPGGQMPMSDVAVLEAEEFDAAVKLFEAESNQVARMAFEQFTEFFPNSENAPRAFIYLGQLRMREDLPQEAIDTYLSIPDRYPESEQVPHALYRAAVVYINLEQFDLAQALLERVVEDYPDHSVAEQARARLEEIP